MISSVQYAILKVINRQILTTKPMENQLEWPKIRISSVGVVHLLYLKDLFAASNRKKLPKLAKLCDRFRVSDRAGASIATAVLEDFGVVSQTESGDVIDRYKLRRERQLARERSLDPIALVEALYFDGRKDSTLKLKKKGSGWFRKTVSEEHVTLMCEPRGKFLTHVTPDSSTE